MGLPRTPRVLAMTGARRTFHAHGRAGGSGGIAENVAADFEGHAGRSPARSDGDVLLQWGSSGTEVIVELQDLHPRQGRNLPVVREKGERPGG